MIKERASSEKKRESKSPWFKQVVKDRDYMIKYNTTTDSSGRDLKYAPIKWWCYDEQTAQKVIPIYDSISKYGRRRPINGKFPFQTKTEII